MKNQKVFLLLCLFFSFSLIVFGQNPGDHQQDTGGGPTISLGGGGGVATQVGGGECGEDGPKYVTYLSVAGENGSSLDLSGGKGDGWTNQIRFHGGCNEKLQHVIASNNTSGRLVIAPGFFRNADEVMEVHGSIAIGTQNAPNSLGESGPSLDGYRLYVNGGILAEEIRVATGWADYVFYDDYRLRPLSEVKTFIDNNGHLPDVPAAKEIEENGMDVAGITVKQQVKIEELFLYILDMEERLKRVESENKELKAVFEEK